MLAGDLDRRIRLYRYTANVDAGGDVTRAWTALQDTYAAFKPLGGAESVVAGKVTATEKAEFTIRYSATAATLRAKDQIEYAERRWDIDTIEQVGGRQHWLKITALLRKANT